MSPRTDKTALRKKARRVAGTLESVLGIPRQKPSLPEPLDMLIATILSQNTNDKNSHRAFTQLRQKFPTWSSVARAPLRSIVSAIRTGGMANQKSARIRNLLAEVRSRYAAYDLSSLERKSNEEIMTELMSFNGVGVKTAACVLLFSLRRDVFPVDTHVHRICSRLGLAPGCRTPEKTFEAMKTLVPRGKGYTFHTNLIRFGRRICRSANPLCNVCPLFDECGYERKRLAPVTGQRSSGDRHDFMLLDNV